MSSAMILFMIFVMLIPLSCNAESSFYTYKDYEYTIESNQVSICKYTGNDAHLIIPNQIDNLCVVSIDSYAFYNNTDTWVIELPESLVTICDFAFSDSAVRFVMIPDSLEYIGDGAFSRSKLTSIYIPQNVTYLGKDAFNSCYNLCSVYIDANIDKIPQLSFFECIGLKDITLPESLILIEEEAFYFCVRLEDIIIRSDIQTIEANAFFDCISLDESTIIDHQIVVEGF